MSNFPKVLPIAGTPKDLDESLRNANTELDGILTPVQLHVFYSHVLDFLANKFGAAILEGDPAAVNIWNKIKGNK